MGIKCTGQNNFIRIIIKTRLYPNFLQWSIYCTAKSLLLTHFWGLFGWPPPGSSWSCSGTARSASSDFTIGKRKSPLRRYSANRKADLLAPLPTLKVSDETAVQTGSSLHYRNLSWSLGLFGLKISWEVCKILWILFDVSCVDLLLAVTAIASSGVLLVISVNFRL